MKYNEQLIADAAAGGVGVRTGLSTNDGLQYLVDEMRGGTWMFREVAGAHVMSLHAHTGGRITSRLRRAFCAARRSFMRRGGEQIGRVVCVTERHARQGAKRCQGQQD